MSTHKAKQIMSKNLITVSAEASLNEAYTIMQKRRIRHLPVIDEQRIVVGILSDRDLQRAMEPQPGETPDSPLSYTFNSNLKVKNFMSAPARCIAEDMAIRDAAQRMLDEKVSMFLVVNPEMEPHGVVTTDDLLRLLISILDKDPNPSKELVGPWVKNSSTTINYLD